MPYRLQELIDISRLQSFIDSFSGVSGIPTAIVGRSGALIASSGWREVCLDFHRATPQALKCCLESNTRVITEVEKTAGVVRQTCPHGFVKAAFPLVVEDEWLATMITGQMLPGEVDEERFLLQARRYGFDEAAYLAALRTIPVLTPEQLERNLTCLQNLTDLIVEMAAVARRERDMGASSQRLGDRYASILATTTDGFWIIDGQGRCIEANDVCAAKLGYSRDELRGMSLRDIDAGETDEETAARIEQVKRDGFSRFEAIHRRKDGSLMEVEISTSYIAGEDLFITFIRDISGVKRAAEELRTSERRFRDLFEHAPVPYQSLDMESKLLEVNDAWCRMMGYERSEVIGSGMERFLAEYARPLLQERMSLLARDGSMSGVACQLLRRDGSPVDVVVEGSIGRDRQGRFERSHCILIDVTEKKKAEEHIHRLNEELEERVRVRTAELQAINRELESFCYSISHDLRAPLRAIDGCSKILQEDYQPLLDASGADLCRRIGSNAIRMGSLIDDLLTFSRVGRASLSLGRLDMTSLARRAFEEMVPEEERGRIDFRLEDLPPARADETAMGQVWANLLGNAVKYSSREPRAVITVTGHLEGESLVYCVQDNGVGFDMAYSNKLFGVFLRAHSPSDFPGTGVGLAIVERIIHRHGGRVWAAGEEGKGATFCFSLPR